MLLRLAIVLALLWSAPAAAQERAGTWTFAIGPVAVFQFQVERDGEDWRAVWLRPRSFASNGVVFQQVTGPMVDVPASRVVEAGEWLELTFADPRPGAVPDVFRLRALPDGTAEAIYAETGFPPFALERDLAGHGLGPWDVAATYTRPGLDAAAAGPPVQFSGGVSAMVNRITNVMMAQESKDEQSDGEPAATAPAMIGR